MTDDPIRVLMVEDQTDLREMIGLALRDLGIDRRSVAFMGYWRRGRAEAA